MIPPKIQSWLDSEYIPQRLLLSGSGDLLEVAFEIGALLQKTPLKKLRENLSADTKVFQDGGESFKIGATENPDPDTVRGMISWISQKPVAPYRLIILENFERMSREAPQAILKILEEPPEKACFIFTTKNHYQILNTILSRMVVVKIPSNFSLQADIGEDIRDLDFFRDNIFVEFFNKEFLMDNFLFIEALDTSIKKQKNKKKLWDFLSGLLFHLQDQRREDLLHLGLETEQYLRGNGNVRLGLERMIMKGIV